ncbi:uncharacterized protein LOC142236260 isoform X2 [Haematobia irritans]|uniref:uncharacterized protein LOC142236260 isoform X2 n=1 Tax=Haematobia irritans TaxID=7368 RepID=UPI003F500215
MKGFKIIKTLFEEKKEALCLCFDGEDNYNIFINEAKKIYNMPSDVSIDIFSNDFRINPGIFSHAVEQYIGSPDFFLVLKLSDVASEPLVLDDCELDVVSNEEIYLSSCSSSSGCHQNQHPLCSSHSDAIRSVSIGAAEFSNFTESNTFFAGVENVPLLPTVQEIKKIRNIQLLMQLKVLENKERTQIAKTIVGYILHNNSSRLLHREDFLQLSQFIVEIFPSEIKESYYVPFQKGHLAKGKLYDAYNNMRTKLSAAGIIKRRIHTRTPKEKPVTSTKSDGIDFDDLRILQIQNSQWAKVLEIWKKSHLVRQNELKNTNMSTYDYMEKYKVLCNERSYDLIEIDFKRLYPQSKGVNDWRIYYPKIISKATKVREHSIQKILTIINKTLDEETKYALALMVVPYLLPTARHNSKLEVQESFIIYSENILQADDETRNNHKRRKLETQPLIYFVGDTTNAISLCYVDLAGIRLKFKDPLKAFEVCFQSFMAMNIKYPTECTHVWTFFQKLIFEVDTIWDLTLPSVSTLINELKS